MELSFEQALGGGKDKSGAEPVEDADERPYKLIEPSCECKLEFLVNVVNLANWCLRADFADLSFHSSPLLPSTHNNRLALNAIEQRQGAAGVSSQG